MMRLITICFVGQLLILGSVDSQFSIFFGQGQGQEREQRQYNPFGFLNSNRQPSNQGNFYYPQEQQNQNFVYPNQPNRPNNAYQTSRPQQNYNRPVTQRPVTANPNLRISERKCKEYIEKSQSSVYVGSLSLTPSIQGIQTDQCDASQGLVVGGENAKAGEFPHMAALGYKNLDDIVEFQCGGSLISERYVLTAAHCRAAGRTRPSVVRLGDLNLKVKEKLPELDIPIQEFISHEQYDPNNSKNDIAVVRLDRNVSFNRKYIRPACLANANMLNGATKAIATGWGLTQAFTQQTSDIMQKVELNIIDNNKCNELYEEYNLDRTQICAGELSGGKDTCQGDSGGPLQIVSERNKCVYLIIGITSYGQLACGAANAPGVYTSIPNYLDWIEQKVWGS